MEGLHGDIEEALPPNAPEPRGKRVAAIVFVGSDRAGDKKDRRSRTGLMVYLNAALIQGHAKKQPAIESAAILELYLQRRRLE